MANLETLTIDGVSMDNFHPATQIASKKTYSLTNNSIQTWDTGVVLPKGLCFIGADLTFPASATGVRCFELGLVDENGYVAIGVTRVSAASNGYTALFLYGVVKNDGTTEPKLACKLYQNSGSTQTVTLAYRIRVFPTLIGS